MEEEFRVRPLTGDLHDGVLRVARSLPGWFTEKGVAEIRADLGVREGLVSVDGEGACVAFLLFHAEGGTGRIDWMGVAPALHRRGIGRALVAALEERLAAAGVAAVEVRTLGDGVDYPPYSATRTFYRSLGFATHLRERHDDPECPESVVLRKPLRPEQGIPLRRSAGPRGIRP